MNDPTIAPALRAVGRPEVVDAAQRVVPEGLIAAVPLRHRYRFLRFAVAYFLIITFAMPEFPSWWQVFLAYAVSDAAAWCFTAMNDRFRSVLPLGPRGGILAYDDTMAYVLASGLRRRDGYRISISFPRGTGFASVGSPRFSAPSVRLEVGGGIAHTVYVAGSRFDKRNQLALAMLAHSAEFSTVPEVDLASPNRKLGWCRKLAAPLVVLLAVTAFWWVNQPDHTTPSAQCVATYQVKAADDKRAEADLDAANALINEGPENVDTNEVRIQQLEANTQRLLTDIDRSVVANPGCWTESSVRSAEKDLHKS